MLNVGQNFREEQYIVLKKVASNDFLVSYLAYMPFTERYVTLVVLNQKYPDETDSQFFHHLASTTARLNHPNVAKVYEAGEEQGLHFYAQEYRLGEVLEKYLGYASKQDLRAWYRITGNSGGFVADSSSLSLDTVYGLLEPPDTGAVVPFEQDLPFLKTSLYSLPIMLQLCELVEYCQGKQVIHGRLSPSEIYLTQSQQVLVSGFCELNEYNKREIIRPFPWSVLPYCPPEIAQGEPADANSDVFSVGALLYRMIVGEWATYKTASKSSLESSILAVSLPQELADLIWEALAKDPSIRLQSISPLKDLFQDIVNQPKFTVGDSPVFHRWYKTLKLPAFQKVSIISRVGKSWRRALDNITDKDALREILQDITMVLCDALCARSSEPQIRYFNGLYYGIINQPLVKIRIPSSFPIVFIPFQTVDQGRMEMVQYLVRTVMSSSEYFAVLVPLLHSDQLGRLGSESVYDFIVLDEGGLIEIIAAENPQNQFVQIILQQIDLVSLSPYIIRGPVPRNMFFGREHEIKNIVQSIKNTSITIVGERKIGKTSILHRVEQILKEDKWSTVYLDCQAVSNYEDFFSVLNFELKTALSGRNPLDFLAFLDRLQREYPDRFIVFLFDEVDALLNYDHGNGETLSKLFRSLSQTNQCRFAFCGERKLHSRQKDPASPFFNFCHLVSLCYLEPRAVAQIISEPMRSLGLTLHRPDELADQIYRISNGHPNIVQYICHRLVESIAPTKRRTVVPADLTAILTGHDFFEYFLEVMWGTATPLEKLVSVLVEAGDFILDDIEQWLKAEGIEATEEQITKTVDNLVLYAIFERKGTRAYKLTASSLPDVIHRHNSLEILKLGLYKEASRWLKQSSNPWDR